MAINKVELPKTEEPFYTVVNFNNSTWPMKDAKRFKTIAQATSYIAYLLRRYPGNSPDYYILRTVQIVRRATPPLEIVEL